MRVRHAGRMGALGSVGVLITGLTLVAPATPSAAVEDCTALTTAVYQTTNPRLTTSLLTRWETEYEKSQVKYGFTEDQGILGYGSSHEAEGLTPVTRMYNRTTADFLYAADDADIAAAQQAGFAVEHVVFYAPTEASECTVGVHRLQRGNSYANAASPDALAALKGEGWTDLGVSFHVKPDGTPAPEPAPPAPVPQPGPVTGDSFSIAVIPDTQEETNVTSDPRLNHRNQWLVENRTSLNLAYVLHTGDITNWGWVAPEQFTMATRATALLADAGIPYAFASGNHDVAVVGHNGVAGSRGYGGSAYVDNPECQELLGDQCKSWLLVRNTTDYNKNFPLSSFANVGGAFESGKSDNMWTTFSAGNAQWLVVTLEQFPRKEAVAWAASVVKNHPQHNVIVQTHNYLSGNGSISGSNGGYGATSGTYLFDNLVKLYPNVKMVFSGHVGGGASRADIGVNGNRILSFMGTYHSRTTNPVRIVTVNAQTGQVTSRVEAPYTNEVWADQATNDSISIIR